ncbi:unnamed protein product [Cylindrotheca closterium]|uniref:G-protein coupled receptors family 3 profile domain-containing protein n=1 Tax=Cylindrotheca closterium TaxID=2856 RepID=A0AAD2GBD1_9STRA|nr:unnamed protein product [Cylindrotheca closterium]
MMTNLLFFSSLPLLLFTLILTVIPTGTQSYRYALVTGWSNFFDPIKQGWNDSCAAIGADCEIWNAHPDSLRKFNHTWEPEVDRTWCVPIMRHLIARGDIDGFAVKCNTKPDYPPVLQEAHDAGIPTVVFAGPHIGPYASYIGTNNDDVGRAMARLLKQLRPEGGTYATVYNGPSSEERALGFIDEIERDNNRDDKAHWMEEPSLNYSAWGWGTIYEYKGTTALGFDKVPWVIQGILETNLTALVFMYQTPTRHPNFTQVIQQNQWRNVSIISVDGNGNEMNFLGRGIIDGLVGEATYDTGVLMPEVLQRIMEEEAVLPQYHTNLLNHNLVPGRLPELAVDQSLLGNLRYIGFTGFGIVALMACIFMWWTFTHREAVVVKASQPFFLAMTAGGVLVMASSLIPLSFDDQGSQISETRAVAICMSIPWLAFCGFSITFSALFAKTWRVNQFFNSNMAYSRIKITEADVLKPFCLLFSLNVIILVCWTIIDPLTYDRKFAPGTDLWNRDIASNGSCSSEHTLAYVAPLGMVSFCVLVIACWQAVAARDIKSEFAEAKWIGWTMFSLAQGFLTGIPIVVVTKDIPEAFYLTLTFLTFALCTVVLLLIFVPKIRMHQRYNKLTPMEQKNAMAISLRKSSNMIGNLAKVNYSQALQLDFSSSNHQAPQGEVKNTGLTCSNRAPEEAPKANCQASDNNKSSGAFYKKIDESEPSKKSSYIDDGDLGEIHQT